MGSMVLRMLGLLNLGANQEEEVFKFIVKKIIL